MYKIATEIAEMAGRNSGKTQSLTAKLAQYFNSNLVPWGAPLAQTYSVCMDCQSSAVRLDEGGAAARTRNTPILFFNLTALKNSPAQHRLSRPNATANMNAIVAVKTFVANQLLLYRNVSMNYCRYS